MNDAQVIKKFASDVIELAKQAQTMAKYASNLRQIQKAASAKEEPKQLNDAKLSKAASAVAALYGDRASVNADSLKQIWSSDHNTIVDSLVKVASDYAGQRVINADNKLVSVKKQASAKPVAKVISKNTAQSAFESAFGINR